LVETRVDGVVSAEIGLKGKPEADIFTTAADNLGCTYDRCIVVEDAVSGVQAGRNGRFGLVLGLAREENAHELLINGADIVLEDMAETSIEKLNEWFATGLEADQWSISYHDYDPKKERSRETLLSVGNGYFGTRGAMEEMDANAVNYPGTYMAGMYNRLITKIADRDIENEDFVNCINWLPLTFRIDGGDWFDANSTKLLGIKRKLNLKNGLLSREMRFEDVEGRQTQIVSERFASMDNPQLAAMRYRITPLNYNSTIEIKSGLDGKLTNQGVERYKALSSNHLEQAEEGVENEKLYVLVKTNQSGHQIAGAARHRLLINGIAVNCKAEISTATGQVFAIYKFEAKQDESVTIEKTVSLGSDKEFFIENALLSVLSLLDDPKQFDELLEESAAIWEQLWEDMDVKVTGDRLSQKLLRLHLFHLLVSVSPVNNLLDASITARGLHGEAYRGHIFWDELYILPLYDLHLPEAARSMLMYRYRRIEEARKYARQHGYQGAMFPWQSGSDGREETQVVHLNPLTGKWGDDYSSLQRHVSLAIAYNVWDYYWITEDIDFMKEYGAEMIFDIARFWASKAKLDQQTGRFEIQGVMGPDEFHEHMPGSDEGGLKDNTYTNLMVAWLFNKTKEVKNVIGNDFEQVAKRMHLSADELDTWSYMARNLNIVFNRDGILAQYDGYFKLKELDWDYYRQKYGNVYRMDRILKAEGKSADEYKVAKQADTLMAFYNLNKDEVDKLLFDMGYELPMDYLQRNLHYYLQRTSHGSTLSRLVHARLAAMTGNRKLSWELYQDALQSDYIDIQGGTTGEGIHAGVMAGTILIALNTFAGINYREKELHIEPNLPETWKQLAFKLNFKGVHYKFFITKTAVEVSADKAASIHICGKKLTLEAGKLEVVLLSN
jgi:trehalose/maltose hydrolase-like predicted phosphorylase